MPFICPSCGEENKDDALMCRLCTAILKKAPPKPPPLVTGHPAWPQVQKHLEAARNAGGNWEEVRRQLQAGFDALPWPAAAALAVTLARQWAAPLRLDAAIRAQLNEGIDRFRGAIEGSRLSEAAGELKKAHEFAADQGNEEWSLVIFGMQALTNRSDIPPPQARDKPKSEPGAASTPDVALPPEPTAPDFDAAQGFLAGFREFNGITLDASLGSLIALDGVLDEIWGSSSNPKAIDTRPIEPSLIVYAGEVAVRSLGGKWSGNATDGWTVTLPGGAILDPRKLVRLRVPAGGNRGFWGQLVAARSRGGQDDIDEPAWTSIGDYGRGCSARGRTSIAVHVFTCMATAKQAPVQAQARFLLSVCARIEKRFEDVVAELDRALALQPDMTTWMESKAAALVELHRLDEARPLLERVIELDPSNHSACLTLGHTYRDAGRFAEAVSCYERTVEARDSFAPGWMALGDALSRAGRHNEGLDAIDRAIALRHRDIGQAHRTRGVILSALGQHDDAIMAFDTALLEGASPADDVWIDRARAELAAGRLDDAMESLSHVAAGNDAAAAVRSEIERDLRYLLAKASACGDRTDADAIGWYRRVLDVEPGHADTLKRLEAVRADHARAVDADPQRVENWICRGDAEQLLGQPDAARASWRRALDARPGPGYDGRQKIHRRLWQLDHPGVAVDPDAAEPFRQEAMKLAGLQKFADALGQLDWALECDPVDAKSWQTKGAALARLGRREEAVEALRTAIAYDAPPPTALRALSKLLVGLGRWDEALPVLDRLTAIDAKNPEYPIMKKLCLEQIGKTTAEAG